jgi:hypothetical protein
MQQLQQWQWMLWLSVPGIPGTPRLLAGSNRNMYASYKQHCRQTSRSDPHAHT